MRRRHLVGRGLLVAVFAGLFSFGFAGHTRAMSDPLRDCIHDRYTQRDSANPINRYRYADNNPINNTDPSGH
jgi:RHS repeat-associated protein